MKVVFLVLPILIFVSCLSVSRLNQQIDKNQKKSLINSPFETAKGMKAELKMQIKFRPQYENDLKQVLETSNSEIIILVENYDFTCFGCPADDVQIYTESQLSSYILDYKNKKYQKVKGEWRGDISEFLSEIYEDNKWNEKPEKYGTDDCSDGGHTFYTIFFPSGKIESMYMRCWIDKEFREE